MDRRTVLQTTGLVVLGASAGCLSVDGPLNESGDNESTDEQPTDERSGDQSNDGGGDKPEMIETDSERVREATLTRTGDCEESGTATVDITETEAVITGCLTGHNGCSEPVVDALEDETDVFRVLMGEADLSDDDTACSQQLVQRGYELRVAFADRPSTIEVVHADALGREVVTTADA